MTLAQATKKAVDQKDWKKLDCLMEKMRFSIGMTYWDMAEYFKKHCGLDLPEFETLMQETGEYEG